MVGVGAANLTFGIISISFKIYVPYSISNMQISSNYRYLSLDNVEFSLKLIPKVEIKKDKQYLTFTDVKLDFETSRSVNSF